MIAGEASRRGKILYFAYGSNMSTRRLRARVPSCRSIGVAFLPDHELRFHKRSKDGSGKCNVIPVRDGAGVFGVIFSFDADDRPTLDPIEGLGAGYDDAIVTLRDAHGGSLQVLTYIADSKHIDEGLRPYSWYKDLVSAGASEHGLPQRYVAAAIGTIETIEDPDGKREAKERAALER